MRDGYVEKVGCAKCIHDRWDSVDGGVLACH